MSVKKEPSGRRSIQVEVEVPGTPEQVWQAIASGPGISSWFVPTKVDGRVGGSVTCSFGPGMDSTAQITEWQPPHRFVAEDKNWMPGTPPLATEWIVEARAGGNCTVRVVHSLFASTADWDDQLGSVENGWPSYFRVLRIYLTHHAGQRSAIVQGLAPASASGSTDETWKTLTDALGVPDPKPGQRLRFEIPGAAALLGTIERVDHVPHGHGMLIRIQEPVPGAGVFGAYACAGMLLATFQLYLYGDRAAAAAEQDQGPWQEWLGALFPAPAQ